MISIKSNVGSSRKTPLFVDVFFRYFLIDMSKSEFGLELVKMYGSRDPASTLIKKSITGLELPRNGIDN